MEGRKKCEILSKEYEVKELAPFLPRSNLRLRAMTQCVTPPRLLLHESSIRASSGLPSAIVILHQLSERLAAGGNEDSQLISGRDKGQCKASNCRAHELDHERLLVLVGEGEVLLDVDMNESACSCGR